MRALAEASGCTRVYLSQIENGRRASPPSEALLARIERALGMDSGTLVRLRRWEASPEEVKQEVRSLATERDDGRRLARLLRGADLDALHRSGELARLVDKLSGDETRERGLGERVAMGSMVPLVNRLMAGPFAEFTDLGYPARIADEYISVPGVSDPDAFAARVHGDSMSPTYTEGDIVVFSPLTQVREGSDCFVRLERDAESTFKRVRFEGWSPEDGGEGGSGEGVAQRVRLVPLNPSYAPTVVDREAIAALYPAVYVMRSVVPSSEG